MTPEIVCPDCNGDGQIIATHVRYADGTSGWGVPHPCFRCHGDGKVPAIHTEWITAGKKMRAERLTRNVGLRAEAVRRGMKPSELSSMEAGRIEPVEAT